MSKELYKQAAQKMLQLFDENKKHEKQAHALQLIYKQVEMGFGELPRSYNELQEKVASLCTQDLNVVEKALELSGGNLDFGRLAVSDPTEFNSTQQFMADIMGNL